MLKCDLTDIFLVQIRQNHRQRVLEPFEHELIRVCAHFPLVRLLSNALLNGFLEEPFVDLSVLGPAVHEVLRGQGMHKVLTVWYSLEGSSEDSEMVGGYASWVESSIAIVI